MIVSRLHSVAFIGLDALLVEVEVDVVEVMEKPGLVIVGLPDTSVRESKDRVLAGIKNSSYHLGTLFSTVNLAPGDLRKEGPLYDLPIAIGLLAAAGIVKSNILNDYLFIGEMGLGGQLRPIHGALAVAMLARELGKKGVLLPAANAKEAAAVPNIDIIPIDNLRQAVQFLENPSTIAPVAANLSETLFKNAPAPVDFAEIKGQAHVKRAMEIAAAGGHNVILSGPPGSGKTMIAKALIGIMPELTVDEALETTKIHSIAGLLPENHSLVTQRPFRSPHHTVSYAGLIGGGSTPRPGEVSLAHNGILFLDELPEFSRATLEVLRQPLEDRKVTISRANGSFTFPTDFVCIAAMNPCPCGNRGHPDKVCHDTDLQVHRYQSKISGPLLDRIDLHIDVPPLRYKHMMEGAAGEPSSVVSQRVKAARARQRERFGKPKTNAQMSSLDLKQHCVLTPECRELMRQAMDLMGVSARAHDRILRVAKTIADLASSPSIERDHLMEAINYRVKS